ncbi:hypothetical protein B0H15DRAFT_869789 [Mycena belliarum]|uniref:Secreted protein n=1 Tax=Mycena belliarum TaxID=1033014 RepID=A0AAD6TSF7_9AGAR|nr:hypothetical protein B0H15DRAFT_869789 [Mycena belliae]
MTIFFTMIFFARGTILVFATVLCARISPVHCETKGEPLVPESAPHAPCISDPAPGPLHTWIEVPVEQGARSRTICATVLLSAKQCAETEKIEEFK